MPASPECQHTEIVPGTNFLPVHAEPSKPGVLPYGDGTAYCCGGYYRIHHEIRRNPARSRVGGMRVRAPRASLVFITDTDGLPSGTLR